VSEIDEKVLDVISRFNQVSKARKSKSIEKNDFYYPTLFCQGSVFPFRAKLSKDGKGTTTSRIDKPVSIYRKYGNCSKSTIKIESKGEYGIPYSPTSRQILLILCSDAVLSGKRCLYYKNISALVKRVNTIPSKNVVDCSGRAFNKVRKHLSSFSNLIISVYDDRGVCTSEYKLFDDFIIPDSSDDASNISLSFSKDFYQDNLSDKLSESLITIPHTGLPRIITSSARAFDTLMWTIDKINTLERDSKKGIEEYSLSIDDIVDLFSRYYINGDELVGSSSLSSIVMRTKEVVLRVNEYLSNTECFGEYKLHHKGSPLGRRNKFRLSLRCSAVPNGIVDYANSSKVEVFDTRYLAAVYKIENLETGKVYVGQSLDYRRRWEQHIGDLRARSHANKYLQEDFNMHGRNSFKFSSIKTFDRATVNSDLLRELEDIYLSEYKKEREQASIYNITNTKQSRD
jgi:hypothetical protein